MHELPNLPYAHDALEPVIDATTMQIHHGKHHQAYVDKANAALKGTKWADLPPEKAITELDAMPDEIRGAVRNNLGGHVNHSLFWRVMAPRGKGGGGQPSGALAEAMNKVWGSLDAFKEAFANAAATRFGSGWAWFGIDEKGVLHVGSTPNQDSPLIHGHTPLLGLDVWEHAYYLKYQNRRPDYVKAWWDVVNWAKVGELYAAAT